MCWDSLNLWGSLAYAGSKFIGAAQSSSQNDFMAAQYKQQAEQAVQDQKVRAAQDQKRMQTTVAAQLQAWGGSGVSSTNGTALDIARDTADTFSRNTFLDAYAVNRQAKSLLLNSSSYSSSADNEWSSTIFGDIAPKLGTFYATK
jgi:hypothetical protein